MPNVFFPKPIDLCASGAEVVFPRPDQIFVVSGSEGSFSLGEVALITTPVTEELVFHVKHSPVQKPPPPRRALFDQPMYAGVDDLEREHFGNVRDARDTLAGELALGVAVAVLEARSQQAA